MMDVNGVTCVPVSQNAPQMKLFNHAMLFVKHLKNTDNGANQSAVQRNKQAQDKG